ncbi:transmembrane signal receptor [Lithospermum erythrorhizon]|uniref:Transmembrane signal receptor n=1 Tax=Lithospermum erythrorhizon TaxID=34254 RepID=A0AAV3RP67_LITER
MRSPDAPFWKEAIDDEMDSIVGNRVWKLASLPHGCKPVGCKWIFKKKMKVDGTIDKFKARLAAKGYFQKEGIDYFDTYAPVARTTTNRVLIALASMHNLVIHQMDVKIAFLNGELDEEVYMEQPKGFIVPGQKHKYVYCKFNGNKGVLICLYVDNMLIFSTDLQQVEETKKFLSTKFSMKDIGVADVILGIKITRSSNGLTLSQSHYIENVLKKFNSYDCKGLLHPLIIVSV